MYAKKQSVPLIWLLSLAVLTAGPGCNAAPHRKFNFNPDWKLFPGDVNDAEKVDFDDSGWKNITTPHAFNENEAFKEDITDLTTGISWYRKHFKIPAEHAGRKVFLEFEGIRQGGEFYLNGEFIGRHENGVMAFGFDITDLVKFAPQENILAARIDNSWKYREKATGQTYQWNDRNFNANYGGIVKNVYLHITDKLYQTLPLYSNLGTTGVYTYAQNIDVKAKTANITAESQVTNEYPSEKTFSYEVIVEDMDGKKVSTIDGGNYTLAPGETKTLAASAKVSGLNFWSWGYGYLYNVYTTLKVEGKTLDVVKTQTGFRKTEFGNGLIKLNNRVIQVKGYAQRTSNEWPAIGLSVPPWISDFSNRMIVEGNGNLIRWMHVTPWKQDVESCDRVGLIQAMPAGDSEKDASGRSWELRLELMRDAIIYNRNNPSIIFYESGNENISEEHMQQMKHLRDKYDPHGGRAAGCREMLDSKVAEYGGEMLYINKSASIPFFAMEYSRDEGLRKYWDEYSPPYHKDGDGPPHRDKPAREYNRNQDSHAIENIRRWYDYWQQRPGTGKRVSSGGVNIIFSDTNTHHRGAENYRRSGEVDPMRIPKDGYFTHRVMWDGWVDVEKPRIHIIGHWNYAKGTKKDVYVVSSADKVELLVNGKSLGFGEQSYRFLFTFSDIEWQAGTVEAIGYDAGGIKICKTQKKTAGEPAAIRLTPRTAPKGLLADGSDLALVDVEVVDAEGNRNPIALNTIDFSLSGPAEWRGGIAQGPDNYILSKTLPVECGVNRVIIRSTTKPGKIVLTAKSGNLKPASVEFVSRKVKVTDGLSLEMPGEGLPSYLERGPTPPPELLPMYRKPVHIVSATANSNSEQANLSIDDNETTGWKSDSNTPAAWIKYDFDKPAAVSEITAKFGAWRRRTYPIRITVDEQEVFTGRTSLSLGYVTIPFEPVTGSSLKIELDTQPSDSRTLEIIEIEIYKKPPDS